MDGNQYNQPNPFNFNLVAPKPKAEIEALEERDNSILYSFLLVFFAMFIYFVLNLLQTFAINQKIEETNSQISTQLAQEQSYTDILSINGELITKGQLLEPVLQKDIKLTQMLEVSADIVKQNPGSEITAYSREPNGEFVLNVKVSTISAAGDLLDSMVKNTQLSDVFDRSLQVKGNGDIETVISFSLSNL